MTTATQTTRPTLADLGPTLPIGVARNGALVRDFVLRPWRMKEEREIGKIRGTRDLPMGVFVSEVLAVMLARLAGEDWGTKPHAEKRLAVGQLYLADVLYLFLYLRREAIGNEVGLDVSCNACKRAFPFTADVDTLEVVVAGADDPVALVQDVVLVDGIPIRGELRKQLKVRPIRWCVMEGLGKNGVNEGTMKLAMFRDAVVGAEGVDTKTPLILTDPELDEMTKRDIERLAGALEDANLGPDLVLTGDCPHCGAAFKRSLDWGYDAFFRASSR